MNENTDELHGVECAACIAKTHAFRKDARPDKSSRLFLPAQRQGYGSRGSAWVLAEMSP
jgi:hypothetical protein